MHAFIKIAKKQVVGIFPDTNVVFSDSLHE